MTEAEAKAMLDQYWEGSTRISSNTAMDLTEVGLRFLRGQPVHRDNKNKNNNILY